MKRRILSIMCVLILLLTMLSGCYDARGLEELAYATALGLDVSENDKLKLTLQISIPSSAGSDSGSSQSNSSESITVECASLSTGISLINSYVSKEIDLTQCNVIVFSEELAERGITEYVDTFANNINIRPDCNVIVSRCTAQDFINNASPSVETLTARYYQVALKSNEYTGYTPVTKIADFTQNMKSDAIQASCILGGVNFHESSVENGYNASNDQTANYMADQLPIENSDTIETFGTAVFYNDKLVGELTGIETVCHLILRNDIQICDISVPDPFNTDSYIDLRLNRRGKTKVDIDFINGTPYISVDVSVSGYGLSLNENIDYDSKENLEKYNESAEQYLKLQIENYLYKTSKDLNSDITGFGKYAISQYMTIGEWQSSSWLENYKSAFFDVNVNVNIESGLEFNSSP